MNTLNGDQVKLADPHTMSGSGVWVVGSDKRGDDEILYIFLVGILTECLKRKFHVIVVNKMERIIKMINDSS